MLRYPEVIKIYERNKCYFPTSMFRFLASEIVYYYNKYGSICIADFLSYLNNKEELIEPFNLVDTMEIDENYTNEEIMDYKWHGLKDDESDLSSAITEHFIPWAKENNLLY